MMNSLMSSDTPLKSARSIKRHANVSALSPRGDICDLMDQLYDDAIEMSDCSTYKAYTWKAIDNLCNVFILVATGVMTALGAAGAIISGASINTAANTTMNIPTSANDSISYAIVAISAVSFIVKGLMMYFLFRKRAISAKNNSIKLTKIARTVKILKNSRLSSQEILRQLDLLYAEIDQIELNAFAEDMGDNIGMAPNGSTNSMPSKTKTQSGVSNTSISEKINVVADTLDVIKDINSGDVKITL